jgi:ribosomal protein S18 acetylase RimI-like enzyme
MNYRKASVDDSEFLGSCSRMLIEDEGHRNPMTVDRLTALMRDWLLGSYEAVIFEQSGRFAAYALFRDEGSSIYLRQLFVDREQRRRGIGWEAVRILTSQIWPPSKRITVAVLAGNRAANRFWRAVGFEDYSILLEMTTPDLRLESEG